MRVFLTVLDSFGVGEAPDASLFGDLGANTLKSISTSSNFNARNLISLGLGNIDGVDFVGKTDTPMGVFGKMKELSLGKDTTVGHWELAGIISKNPMPTYENGFPKEVISKFEELTGYGVLCNKPYSGTQVIMDYGREHLESGKLIVYTSADSVFQIAAHEELLPPERLYEICKIARGMLTGKHGVGRVIARPFTGEYPNFKRTENRRDFSLEPPSKTMLDALLEKGKDVISIGKIYDIFASRGISKYYLTHSNAEGIDRLLQVINEDFDGLCFTNLVDFDMLYGHRNDKDGYAKALFEFDTALLSVFEKLRDDDIFIITADHGCDPCDASTDHTREFVPLIIYKKGITPCNLGTVNSFSSVAKTVTDLFDISFDCQGESLKKYIM